VCVGIAIERALYLTLNSAPRGPYEAALGAYLGGGPRAELEQRLTGMRGLEPRVLLAGFHAAKARASAAEDALIGTLSFERLKMERGLLVIGTVASNAPFIGLFGTVLGIIKAFHDLALDASKPQAVMAGISEALVATAVGLMVAIPAVVLYNYFTRRVKETIGRAESMGALVLSRLHADERS
jgi:biopolymer transport protein ExbB